MPIQKWSENVSVVHLGDDPQFSEDLNSVDDQLAQQPTGIVLDFAAVHVINSSGIARLLKLRKNVQSKGQRLVLCGMSTQVWGAFLVTGLDKLFECSDNVPTALATLQMA